MTKEKRYKTIVLLNLLKSVIEESFVGQLFDTESSLTTQTASLIGGAESFYTLRIFPLLSGIATVVGEIVSSTAYISGTVSKILVQTETLPKTRENLLSMQLKDIKIFLKEWKKDLINN